MFTSKVRTPKRARVIGVALIMGAASLIGTLHLTSASAMQADQNYMPNGCKAGQASYTSYTNGKQPCNQWPAWVRKFGGGGAPAAAPAAAPVSANQADQTYMPNGCKAGQQTYTSYTNGRQPCNKWPAWNRQFGGGAAAPVVNNVAAPAPASSKGAAIVAAARSQIGVRYVFGGGGAAGPNKGGFDCSGLTQFAYARAGISIPRSSTAQNASMGHVPISQLQPGDLVWRPGHVAVYIGNGRIIEAPKPGSSVMEASLRSEFRYGLRA